MIKTINKERASVGVGALSYDSNLQRIVNVRVDDLVKIDDASHTRPDGSVWITLFTEADFEIYGHIGKNAAYNYYDPYDQERVLSGEFTAEEILAQKIYKQYSMSQGHYDNMMNSEYTHMSTGLALVDNPTFRKPIFNIQIFVERY